MVLIQVSLHPQSLHPSEAARAHYMRYEEFATWEDIAAEVVNLQAKTPSLKAVRCAVAHAQALKKGVVPQLKYKSCGRQKAPTKDQEREAAKFMKKWRHKRFCTSEGMSCPSPVADSEGWTSVQNRCARLSRRAGYKPEVQPEVLG